MKILAKWQERRCSPKNRLWRILLQAMFGPKVCGFAQHGAALLHCEERETSRNIPRGIRGAELRLFFAPAVLSTRIYLVKVKGNESESVAGCWISERLLLQDTSSILSTDKCPLSDIYPRNIYKEWLLFQRRNSLSYFDFLRNSSLTTSGDNTRKIESEIKRKKTLLKLRLFLLIFKINATIMSASICFIFYCASLLSRHHRSHRDISENLSRPRSFIKFVPVCFNMRRPYFQDSHYLNSSKTDRRTAKAMAEDRHTIK